MSEFVFVQERCEGREGHGGVPGLRWQGVPAQCRAVCHQEESGTYILCRVVYFRRTSEDDIHICASCCGVESRHLGSAAITFSFSYFSSPLEDNYSVQWCILIFKDFDVLAKLELYNPLSGKNHDSK